jgi:type IV pilus assembly protein PilB
MAKLSDRQTKSDAGGIDPSELKGRRFGRVLAKLGKVTRDQVHEALGVQKARKDKGQDIRIGELLVELGYITKDDVMEALAGQSGMRMVHVDEKSIPDAAFDAMPPETANTYQIIPLAFDERTRSLTIAMKSPDNFRAVDDLRLLMGFKVNAVVAPSDEIDKVLGKRYSGQQSSMASVIAELGESDALNALQGRGDSVDLEVLAQAAGDNKVIRLTWCCCRRSRTRPRTSTSSRSRTSSRCATASTACCTR